MNPWPIFLQPIDCPNITRQKDADTKSTDTREPTKDQNKKKNATRNSECLFLPHMARTSSISDQAESAAGIIYH